MRNANSQCADIMVRLGAPQQPPASHVSHAETGGRVVSGVPHTQQLPHAEEGLCENVPAPAMHRLFSLLCVQDGVLATFASGKLRRKFYLPEERLTFHTAGRGAFDHAFVHIRSGRPALRLADHEIAEHLHPGHALQLFRIHEIGIDLN